MDQRDTTQVVRMLTPDERKEMLESINSPADLRKLPLYTLHAPFQGLYILIRRLPGSLYFLQIYSTVRVHTEFIRHLFALHCIECVQRNGNQDKTDAESNHQDQIPFHMAQHIIESQKNHHWHALPPVKAYSRMLSESLPSLSSPDSRYG